MNNLNNRLAWDVGDLLRRPTTPAIRVQALDLCDEILHLMPSAHCDVARTWISLLLKKHLGINNP